MTLAKVLTLATLLVPASSVLAQSTEVICDTIDICKKNNSDTYVTYTTSRSIAENHRLCVFTSRYTDFNAVISGKGDLYIYSGGERTYLGEHKDKKYPAWPNFKGSMHVFPYKKVDGSAGFYGVVMNHNGKAFSPENIDDCVKSGKVNTMLGKNVVVLHEGSTMASENGVRACRLGELQMEKGSKLYGYYKSNSSAQAFYMVGNLGTDAVLAGQILPSASSGSAVGLIKEGTGTYRITGTGNNINAGIRILDGAVMVNSATTVSDILVFRKGVLGGTGTVNGNTEAYGTVNPGDELIGSLKMKTLQMHPESRLMFDITDADNYDQLTVTSTLKYAADCEDFTTSEQPARIKVKLSAMHDVKVGDQFTLLKAKSKSDFRGADWQFTVILPVQHTWAVDERNDSEGYSLTLRVVSLDDDPANAGNDDDDEPGGDIGGDGDDDTTTYGNDGDRHYLRYYADQAKKKIGVAVSTWYQNLNDGNDASTKAIKDNFNMIVAENEMKFENTEPSRNNFSYGGGDQIVQLASYNNMMVRGHTLAWHSQCPGWLSVDGKKNDKNWTRDELLGILKNHILNVVGHYRLKVSEWDVVNECLDDDQSILRTNPNGYKLRSESVWTKVIGEDFIDSAFVWAHQADKHARLYLNDYDVEFKGKAKTQALYNLAKRLKESGIPIDGVGLQCHFDVGNVDSTALNDNIAQFADLGLYCMLTEVDLGTPTATADNLQRQARNYHAITNIVLNNDNCRGMVIWGLADNISWRTNSNPLLFSNGLVRKPAYFAVRHALRTYLATDIFGVKEDRVGLDLFGNSAFGSYLTAPAVVNHSLSAPIMVKNGRKYLLRP